MGTSPVARAQEINWQGFMPPFVYYNGPVVSTAGTVAGAALVAPCDLFIRRVLVWTDVVATNAGAKINLGSIAQPTIYMNGGVLTNLPLGQSDITSSPGLILRKIPALTPFRSGLVNLDTVGSHSLTVVLEAWRDQGSMDN